MLVLQQLCNLRPVLSSKSRQLYWNNIGLAGIFTSEFWIKKQTLKRLSNIYRLLPHKLNYVT